MSDRSQRSSGLWLRWSVRELRRHRVPVVVISVVMAIGIGVFAGLGSTATWRRVSNDASFGMLAFHDLRLTLSPGTFAGEGDLRMLVDELDDPAVVDGAEERLVVESQIDASTDADTILVAARLVGMEADPAVDRLWVSDGEFFSESTGVLEAKFADFWSLPPSGTVRIAGDRELTYVGLGTTPEHFYYEGPEGSALGEGELAPVYVSMAGAQAAIERPGAVNELVVSLIDGADHDAVGRRLAEHARELGLGARITTAEDEVAFRLLYEDIDNDQRFWNILAGLVLAAAAIGAFNLVSRIVEAQRREIGIGMALGLPRWKLAVRPLLVGLQVGVLATIIGIGVGVWIGRAMADLLESFLPLPDYRTPFQLGTFLLAAALGIVVPVVASAIPVWRAVRVEPIEAIRTGHLTARSSRLTDLTRHLPLPGGSLTHMPVRNFLRTPRRTVLTALGVGAAIAALVAVFGLLDSFERAIDDTGAELSTADPERVVVQLDTFYDLESPEVVAIRDASTVASIDTGLRLPATARGPDDGAELDLLVEALDVRAARWTPTIERSIDSTEGSLVVTQKALDDLGVDLGESIRLEHPVRRADGSFTLTESELVVGAVHANPFRTFAFVDIAEADRFGLTGTTNVVQAYPEPGSDRAGIQRELFGMAGVASSQPVAKLTETFDDAMSQFVGVLVIAAVAVLALALLIAFNTTRITLDERRREHATMRAFGLPVRSVIGVVVKESVLIGALSTLVGLALGVMFLDVMLGSLATTTLPDLAIDRVVAPTTVLLAIAVGILAVAVAPLFLVRRVRRMDIPDTLRTME